ncbi:MAG: Stp1/IreP family PP2C-type Ser/Thr phosphatase [Acidobacteriota bacterium]
MEINAYGKSDIGRVRSANEDFFARELINGKENLFIVADGMGGHQAGNVASKLGTEEFLKKYKEERTKNISISKSMHNAIIKANQSILNKANSDIDKRGMGTTFSALLISEYKAYIVHVGDSRIYLIRNGKIKKVTTDHTFVEKMVDEGKISEEDARKHPQKNILYMSLGARDVFYPDDVIEIEVKDNDIFIICSDGLTDMVTDDIIKEYSESYPAKRSVDELILLSNKTGGLDNITIQNIHIGQDERKNDTKPIKIKKKSKKQLYSLIAAIIITGIFLGILFRKSDSSNQLKFEQLNSSEKVKLGPEFSWVKKEDSIEFSDLVSEKPLYVHRDNETAILFLRDRFLKISKGKISGKGNYVAKKKKITLDRIFYDSYTKSVVAIDNENKIYKIKTVK